MAQKRSVMFLNNARQLAAFREYRIFPLFPPGRRLFFLRNAWFPTGTRGCLSSVYRHFQKKHFLKLKVPSCTFYDGAPGIMCKGSWELKHLWKALCTHQAAGAITQLLPGLVTAWRITPARWSTCICSLPQAGGRETRWNALSNAVRSPFASSLGKEDVSVDPHHITCKPPRRSAEAFRAFTELFRN